MSTPDAAQAPDTQAGWIAVGRILGAFGTRGEMRVRPLGRFPERFRELRDVFVGEAHQPATIVSRRPQPDSIILRLSSVQTRDAARALHGEYLYVPEDQAVRLPAGEYFVHQIVGLTVVTTEGDSLGTVAEVLHTGSNDVYVVRGGEGARKEILLPAIKDVIQEVDLEAKTLRVALLPGLVE